jgi:uncharacterized protein YfdQ (DUF2303 family)
MSTTTLESKEAENLAQTLARELPKPSAVLTDLDATRQGLIHHIALPKGHQLHTIDNEAILPNPRRTKAQVALSDAPSFIQYVTTHKNEGTVVWCNFNPQTYKLDFKAIVNDHSATTPGWRDHVATYTPAFSAEWKTWTSHDKQSKGQAEFAEFIEANERDIGTREGFPTSLQMLEMATNFVARQDQLLKSAVRLQSGGINMSYIADPDKGTVETMKVFEKFALGLPVFWGGPGYQATARLKYRLGQGKVTFFYELIRPDLIHQAAALELITTVRTGVGEVPVLMGLSN